LNLELARLPETVSNPTIGSLRLQFWRDAVKETFAGRPRREPISILLHEAITNLRSSGEDTTANSIKFWLLRFIGTRERHFGNRPFPTIEAMEEYAETTYSALIYMTLASTSARSVHLDHLASHIGKACGIAAVLKGIPALAGWRKAAKNPGTGGGGGNSHAVLLPLDVMTSAGLSEEAVFRQGPEAPGLEDAVFEVATRAHGHIETARDMFRSLKAGLGPGHAFEHEGEAGHIYADENLDEGVRADLLRAFGVFLEAVPAAEFLASLEKAHFNPFSANVLKDRWWLPLALWRSLAKKEI